jgi:homoserine O-acetyltransferase/O-succinyltransferase
MLENDYYSQENHGPYELFDLGDFELDSGGTIRGCQLAFTTFGELNTNKDNAILITTWYSGTSKIMEQAYVGQGRAIDPDKYFVVIINQIGNGLSTSPHNTPAPFGMAKFPRVRIGDDVRAQHRLLTEKYGIDSLALVVGGSMGAQQTWEWAVRFPEMVKRAAPIAGTAKNTPHDFLYTKTLNEAITSDPAWDEGCYTEPDAVHRGLRRHADLWSVMGYSTEMFKQERWRELGFSSLEDFTVGFTQGYFLPMDPNNLLCLAWKWQRGDVSRITGGDLEAALGRITAKMFVMPISTDMFFPPRDCEDHQKMVANSEFRVIESDWGHLGLFGMDPKYTEQVDYHLSELLALPV